MAARVSWWNISLWLGGIGYLLAVWAVFVLSAHSDSKAAAQWMQTIASVLALAVGIGVPLYQDARRRSQEQQRAVEAAKGSIIGWIDACIELGGTLSNFKKQMATFDEHLSRGERMPFPNGFATDLIQVVTKIRKLTIEVSGHPINISRFADFLRDFLLLINSFNYLMDRWYDSDKAVVRNAYEQVSVRLARTTRRLSVAQVDLETLWYGVPFSEWVAAPAVTSTDGDLS